MGKKKEGGKKKKEEGEDEREWEIKKKDKEMTLVRKGWRNKRTSILGDSFDRNTSPKLRFKYKTHQNSQWEKELFFFDNLSSDNLLVSPATGSNRHPKPGRTSIREGSKNPDHQTEGNTISFGPYVNSLYTRVRDEGQRSRNYLQNNSL